MKKETIIELKKSGILLCDELEKDLTDLGIQYNGYGFTLEYLLKLIPIVNNSVFFKMFYNANNKCIVLLEDGRSASEELKAEADFFVNAAGLFLVKAITRGFVKTNWQDLLKLGLKCSDYQIKSGLLVEKNYLMETITAYSAKKIGNDGFIKNYQNIFGKSPSWLEKIFFKKNNA